MFGKLVNSINKKINLSIRVTIVSIFIFATTVTASFAIGLQYHFSNKMAVNSSLNLFNITTNNISYYLHEIDKSSIGILNILSESAKMNTIDNINKGRLKAQFSHIIKNNPEFYALYVGFDEGSFYELINLNVSKDVRKHLKAMPSDRWVVITIKNKEKISEYFDEQFNLRTSLIEKTQYDPRKRPWYINSSYNKIHKTKPYQFSNIQAAGITYSIKMPFTETVMSIDVALPTLSEYLIKQEDQLGKAIDSEIYVFSEDGEIIGSNLKDKTTVVSNVQKKLSLNIKQRDYIKNNPTIEISNQNNWPPIDFSTAGKPQGYSIELLSLISQLTGITFNYQNGLSWPELKHLFKKNSIDILQPIFMTPENQYLGLFSEPIIELPFSLITSEQYQTPKSLDHFNGKKLAIPKGWSVIKVIKQYYPNIHIIEMKNTRAVLEAVSSGEVEAGIDNNVIFKYIQKQYFINNIAYHQLDDFKSNIFPDTLHLLVKHDNHLLLSILNKAIEGLSQTAKTQLTNKWLNAYEKPQQTLGGLPYKELLDLKNKQSNQNTLILKQLNDENKYIYLSQIKMDQNGYSEQNTYLAIIVPEEDIVAISKKEILFSIVSTALCLLLLLPISWLIASPIVSAIKRLANQSDIIKERNFNDVNIRRSRVVEIQQLSSSLIDLNHSIQEHETNQKALIESFIQLIAQAIDDKSPYTAGHCERVPELGIMLAKAAAESNSPPFNSFSFKNENEFREFSIAAWLHDCGKITTPEHIVDKGSKLETIYNRIHEIRMRFEVLWRDAEIDYLKAIVSFPENQLALSEKLIAKQKQLTNDFEFIANTNIGGEYLDKSKVERLHDLSKKTWLRYFDSSLGLSPIEELKLSQKTFKTPVIEQLLADKAEHLIPHDQEHHYPKHLGIKIKPEKYKYNLGEIYNLSISRGTLTVEDRFKINEHIISTIKMLENLPFPPELAKVPRYASTHHETLDGKGYPRKLTKNDLSIPERVLVLADIFEALTAADRPYKKAKPISVAIDILHKMVLNNHVDEDIFQLFLHSGIYLKYAKKYLDESQIDSIDISQYLVKDNTEAAT